MSDSLDYESAERSPAGEPQSARQVEPQGTPPYGWMALSCGAALIGLTIVAATASRAMAWGPAVALIPPVQLLGLFLAWRAMHAPRRAVGLAWAAAVLNLLAITIGALIVWGTRGLE